MEALQHELDQDPNDGANDPRAELIRLQAELDEKAALLDATQSASAKLLETTTLKNKELRDKNKALEAKVAATTFDLRRSCLTKRMAISGGGA